MARVVIYFLIALTTDITPTSMRVGTRQKAVIIHPGNTTPIAAPKEGIKKSAATAPTVRAKGII